MGASRHPSPHHHRERVRVSFFNTGTTTRSFCFSRRLSSMTTNPTKTKPLAGPPRLRRAQQSRLDQASSFRAEDKEAVKAAAEALKFSVIELITDADKALAAGAHEGVLKGGGRDGRRLSCSGGLPPDQEHVRKGVGAPDPSRPESRRRGRRPNPRQNKTRTPAGRVRSRLDRLVQPRLPRRLTSRIARPLEKPCGSARGPRRLLEQEARVRGFSLGP